MERHRLSGSTVPLKAVILGCTHYPFHLETMQKVVRELREYRENGRYPYRDLLAEDLVFIDPAHDTAVECYRLLREAGLLAEEGAAAVDAFISVPAAEIDPACLTPDGKLTYEFKYGRNPGDDPRTRPAMEEHEIQQDFLADAMGMVDKVLEVLIGAVLRIDMEIVPGPIGIPGIVESGLDLARAPVSPVHIRVGDIDRQEIDRVDPKVQKAFQMGFGPLQGAFLAHTAGHHLVCHSLSEPFRRLPGGLIVKRLGRQAERRRQQKGGKE